MEEDDKQNDDYDNDKELERIREYLIANLGDKNIKEIKIFNRSSVNRPLYHISMNGNIKQFNPQVSKRTLQKEDRSVPRISTSTCLIGCMNGYQSMDYDMSNREKVKFDGLYTIYNLPYLYALRPSSKLLQDVELTDEYWLFSWKKETYAFYPEIAGHFIIQRIEHEYTKKGTIKTFHVCVEVKEGSLYISQDKKLSMGYYHLILKGYDYDYPLKDNDNIIIKKLDQQDYYRLVSEATMMIPLKGKKVK